MSDHIDGSLTSIAQLALSTIYYSIESNNLNEINNKYHYLSSYSQGDFLIKTSPESRIETCLMILCILNYAICKRKDLL